MYFLVALAVADDVDAVGFADASTLVALQTGLSLFPLFQGYSLGFSDKETDIVLQVRRAMSSAVVLTWMKLVLNLSRTLKFLS